MADPASPRVREIVAVARDLLEREGPEALTMRRIAAALGIRAPSLYKHVPGKPALEVALTVAGFEEAAAAFEAATAGSDDPLPAFVAAYRAFARAHPHLYRLMTDRPLPRADLPAGLEARTAAPLLRATGSPERARAAFGFVHGMVLLELTGRFPDDGLTGRAWAAGIAALRPAPR
ncbi:TetR/AcrR family transcriptional regulator [Geodermatophilus amargosae]|uniref:TetR/AcrR family transcriptional regulator n=1 Tax=Geodermatophilus amargosae TaxID=1296565 RepID=UPI0034E00319